MFTASGGASQHWADGYYGDLYFDSASDLLTPAMSEAEAAVVVSLLRPRAGDLLLDLACGHGRHAWPLSAAGYRVVGLERSGAYLARAAASGAAWAPAWVRGDVRSLPLREGSVDAAFSWYSSLFMYDDATNVRCLAEAGRVVRRGGRLLVQHANPAALDRAPVDASRRTLRDGSVVEEESRWDASAGIDRCARRLTRPDGTVLAGTAELRYYTGPQWRPLAAAAGLRLLHVTSTTAAGRGAGAEPGDDAPDLVAVLERPA